MSWEHVTFDWLIPTCPKEFMRGNSSANDDKTPVSFIAAHDRAVMLSCA